MSRLLGASASFASHHGGPGTPHPEASLVVVGWGVALSGVRCKFTLEFQLCYHVSLGSCDEGIPGWRKVFGGVWPQRTGPSTPPVLPSAHSYQSPWYQALGWAAQGAEERTARPGLQSSQSGPCCLHVCTEALGGQSWRWSERVWRSCCPEVHLSLKERVGIPQAGTVGGHLRWRGQARQSPGDAEEPGQDSRPAEELRLSS